MKLIIGYAISIAWEAKELHGLHGCQIIDIKQTKQTPWS
jgi:hypothetical protein